PSPVETAPVVNWAFVQCRPGFRPCQESLASLSSESYIRPRTSPRRLAAPRAFPHNDQSTVALQPQCRPAQGCRAGDPGVQRLAEPQRQSFEAFETKRLPPTYQFKFIGKKP